MALKSSKFKDQGYELISSVAKAMGNPHRLELLELLGNGPKSVQELAKEARLSITNTSAHLQKLKQSKLVKTRRSVNTIYYRVADESVLKLIMALHKTTYSQFEELKLTINHFREQFGTDQAATRTLPEEDYILLDVRPQTEYWYGHKPGAINIPHYNLNVSLGTLNKDKLIIVYSRGELCTLADEVVQKLTTKGFRAMRFEDIVMMKTA